MIFDAAGVILKWAIPPRIKVLEALGAIVDGRVEFVPSQEVDLFGNQLSYVAKVFSSTKSKLYTVTWAPAKNAVMSNDNSAYWKSELSYPSIALLMLKGVLPLDKKLSIALKGISWKDINQKHSNDWAKTEEEVFLVAHRRGVDREELKAGAEKVLAEIEKLGLELFGDKVKPPQGY